MLITVFKRLNTASVELRRGGGVLLTAKISSSRKKKKKKEKVFLPSFKSLP